MIQPASGLTWIGWYSESHKYPAQQRFYTITADPKRGDRPGVDVVHTPSADGVEMGIEGTLYFSLNLDDKTCATSTTSSAPGPSPLRTGTPTTRTTATPAGPRSWTRSSDR